MGLPCGKFSRSRHLNTRRQSIEDRALTEEEQFRGHAERSRALMDE
tara:strand:- start:132 stop:269 length:138 start_codon:yes stop_codon:yes gene_type:complete